MPSFLASFLLPSSDEGPEQVVVHDVVQYWHLRDLQPARMAITLSPGITKHAECDGRIDTGELIHFELQSTNEPSRTSFNVVSYSCIRITMVGTEPDFSQKSLRCLKSIGLLDNLRLDKSS